MKFTVPKQATLREAVVELAENEQLVYRLRDYRLRIVDQDYGKKTTTRSSRATRSSGCSA